jgi:hypothetical protein
MAPVASLTPMTPMNPMASMTPIAPIAPIAPPLDSYDSYFYLSSTFLLFQAYRANYEALLAQLGGCAGADTYTRREPNDTLKRRR